MVLTFKSTRAEVFTISNTDEHGRTRTVTASKMPDDWNFKLTLRHPSGETWSGTYTGRAGILDAMAEMMTSRDAQFVQDRDRGDRPRPEAVDRNRSVREDGSFSEPSIIPRR
jgi:hypothetical protein